MLRSEELKKLILTHQRRLLKLKEQQAVFGASVDPSVLIQIEDIETELARLREELVALPPDEAESDEIITPPVTATRAPKPLNLAEAKPHQGELPLPVTPSPPARAPWPVRQWPWLASGLLVIGVAVGLVGNQMGGWFFAMPTPTVTPTYTATAIVEPTATAPLTPSPEPFNPDTYPKGAVTQPVEVRLWAAPGCDEPILDLEKQLRADPYLDKLIASSDVSLNTQSTTYVPATPSATSTRTASQPTEPATLDIWATCDKSNPEINFKLSEITGLPPEVYSPTEVSITEQPVNPLLSHNITLGLIYYQQRDYAKAAKLLGSPTRETGNTILGLLYGNSLLFQPLLQPDAQYQIYPEAIKVYEKAASGDDTQPDLATQIYNNLGVTFFLLGECETALTKLNQAIAFPSNQSWLYFNRAYARLCIGDTNQRQAVTDDCQKVVQAGKDQNDSLVQAAGYSCLISQLLGDRSDPNYENEINQLLSQIKIEMRDYPLPLYLNGRFYEATNEPEMARQKYACYLLIIRDWVKLPSETGQILLAQDYLANENQPLEKLCPIFLNGFQ